MLYFTSTTSNLAKKCEAEIINKFSYWIRIESFFENTTLQFLLEVQGNLYHTLRQKKKKKSP